MALTATIARWIVRLCGLFQIVTGLLFWSGNAVTMVQFHMLTGILLVLSLWVLTFVGARSGAPGTLVGFAAVWGAVVFVFGMSQSGLLPGDLHWIIQTLHLLVGVAAIAIAERLGAIVKRHRSGGGPRTARVTGGAL